MPDLTPPSHFLKQSFLVDLHRDTLHNRKDTGISTALLIGE